MEILLLHPGGLGDILLALPAIALLRRKFPGARITMAANLDHLAPIAGLWIDKAVSLSTLPLHNLFSSGELPKEDVLFWKSFDRMFSWTGSGDAGFARKIVEANPNARVARWRPGPRERRHVSQLFIDSLGPEIAEGEKASPVSLSPDSELSGEGREWLAGHGLQGREPLVTVHPGAGSITKRWPLERFISLCRSLGAEGRAKFLIIEGPAESGLAASIAEQLPADLAIRAECLPLNLLAAVIAESALFIGNDSGIAHLAACLRIPSVVIFGPTLPRHWAPLGAMVRVLRDSGGCVACALEGSDHACLENVKVEDAVRAIRDLGFEI